MNRNLSFEKRRELCNKIIAQYPDRVPIIVKPMARMNITLDQTKFLAPQDISMGAFLYELRKHTSIRPDEALYIFCGKSGALVPTHTSLREIYSKHGDPDGFMYMTVALENTFGFKK